MCIRDSNNTNQPSNQGGNNPPSQYRRANYVQANYDPDRRRRYQRRNSFSGDRGSIRGGRWRSSSIEGDSRNYDYRPQVNFVQAQDQSDPGRPDTRPQPNTCLLYTSFQSDTPYKKKKLKKPIIASLCSVYNSDTTIGSYHQCKFTLHLSTHAAS